MTLKEKYHGKKLTTDEAAEAQNEINKAISELESINYQTGDDYILFKWGSLKGFRLNSEKGKALSNEYSLLGRSISAMCQKDTERQKELINFMIDECDGVLQSDWSGEHFTKKQAKEYLNKN